MASTQETISPLPDLDELTEKCTACPDIVEALDPEGDVIICVGSSIKLRVSTKVLSVASSALKAMFKPGTFLEGRSLSVEDPPTVHLPADHAAGFRVICRSLYHQYTAAEERNIPPDDLFQAAVIINKYLMRCHVLEYRPCSSLPLPGALKVASAAYLMNAPILFSRASARLVQGWGSRNSIWSSADDTMHEIIPDDVFHLLDRKKSSLQQHLRVMLRDIVETHAPRDPSIWSSLQTLLRTKDSRGPAGQPSTPLSAILTGWERESNSVHTRAHDKAARPRTPACAPGILATARGTTVGATFGTPPRVYPAPGAPSASRWDRIPCGDDNSNGGGGGGGLDETFVSTRRFVQALYRDAKEYVPRATPSKKDIGFVMRVMEVCKEWHDYTGALCVKCVNDEGRTAEQALGCWGCYKA